MRKLYGTLEAVHVPFAMEQTVAFIYDGRIRVGVVHKVTAKVITLRDSLKNEFRSFRIDKVNRS